MVITLSSYKWPWGLRAFKYSDQAGFKCLCLFHIFFFFWQICLHLARLFIFLHVLNLTCKIWAYWSIPLLQALRKLGQEEHVFKASPEYIAGSCLRKPKRKCPYQTTLSYLLCGRCFRLKEGGSIFNIPFLFGIHIIQTL